MSERVATLRGIDGSTEHGHPPAARRMLYAMTAWVALSVGGVLNAREPRERPIETPVQAAVQQRAEITEQQLWQWMRDMDDDEFSPRQTAWDAALKELWMAFDTEQQDVNALLHRIKTDTYGRPRAVSAEQKARVDNLELAVKQWRTDVPQALAPAGVISGGKAFEQLRAKAGLPLGFDKDMKLLDDVRVDLRGDREDRLVNNVFAQLCNATKTKPWRHNNGTIDLTPAWHDESVVWSKDLVGIVIKNDAGLPQEMSLQMEPGKGALLTFVDEEGEYGVYGNCCIPPPAPPPEAAERPAMKKDGPTLRIALPHRPKWTGTIYLTELYQEMPSMHATHIDAIVADMPASTTVTVGGEAKQLGPQSIKFLPAKELPNGGWMVTCSSDIFAKVDWKNSDPAWDMLTYELGDANRYVVRDEQGKEMNVRIDFTDFRERNMWVGIACPRKPASATVTAMTRLEARRLELPTIPITAPAPAVAR